LLRTFIIGIVSGAILAAALLYLVPVVDQHREASLISVQPNGGNTESFHVNLPDDRILAGGAGKSLVPATLEWPEVPVLGDAQAELFKIRNRDDVVVGVASRISGTGTASGTLVEWTLHLPARGTLYVNLQPQAGGGGLRTGTLRAGTREFASMTGSVNERLVGPVESPDEESGLEGRIELVTALVGTSGSIE
jgi:hypothetical protein